MATDSKDADKTTAGTLSAVTTGTGKGVYGNSRTAKDSSPVADDKLIEFKSPIVSLCTGE